MSEFREVCKQWRRLCISFQDRDKYDYHSCAELCPVGTNPVCGELDEATQEDIERFEAAVMKWAEEHPEPQYPTWREYIYDYCVKLNPDLRGCNDYQFVAVFMGQPIPADLAQKLELQPKEGV